MHIELILVPTSFFFVEAPKSQCATGPRSSGFLGSAARILVWAVAWSGLAWRLLTFVLLTREALNHSAGKFFFYLASGSMFFWFFNLASSSLKQQVLFLI
jgi:hypothetical protein